MAFAVKYRIDFADTWKKAWRIDIQEDAFSGSITELTATGNPLNIEFNSGSDEYNDPVRPSKAVFSVQSLTDFQLTDFYSDQDFRFKVIIYCGASVYWQGFVVTSEYSEPYDCTPYPVTITAIDGLNYLKNILYDNNGVYYEGRKTISQILIDIFAKIQITGFTEYVNLYESNMADTVDDSPFSQTVVDVDVFKDFYCFEVLTELLKPFNAVVRQSNAYSVVGGPSYGSEIITSWTNSGFETFTTSGKDITSAIDNGAGFQAAAMGNLFTLANADVLEINITLTNNVAGFPMLYFDRYYGAGTKLGIHWHLISGLNTFTVIMDQDYYDCQFYFSSPIPVVPLDFSAVCSAKLYLSSSITEVAGGEIVIYRPNELTSTVYGRKFTDAVSKTSVSYNPEQFINRTINTSDLRQFPGSVVMIRPAMKNIFLNQDYGIKESWIKNWELKGDTYDDVNGVYEHWTNAGAGINCLSDYIPGERDGLPLPASAGSPSGYSAAQSFGSFGVVSATDFVGLQFEYLFYNFSGSTITGVVYYMQIYSSGYYLRDVDEETVEWHNASAYITITVDILNGSSGWLKYSKKVTGITEAGPFTAVLWSPHSSGSTSFIAATKNIKFFVSSVEISSRSVLVGMRPVKAKGFITRADKRWIQQPFYVKELYQSPVNVIRKTYEISNSVFGKEFTIDFILGDVADSDVDNVVEQFAGALSMSGLGYRVDTITLANGEAAAQIDITCDGLTEAAEWDTDLATTAAKFVTDHASEWTSHDITVTSSGPDIIFTSDVLGMDFTGETTAIPDLGSLTGTVEYTTLARPLTSLTYTTEWNTRGGSEADPLLELIGGEIGSQYARPKQLIQMNIQEMNHDNPVLNIIGNVQDEVNNTLGNIRKFVVNLAEFDVKSRRWSVDLVELINEVSDYHTFVILANGDSVVHAGDEFVVID